MRLRSDTVVIGGLAAAATVSVIASIKILIAHPDQYGADLVAYVAAAKRLLASGTPYAPQLHAGPLENIGSNIPNAYSYPPPLAQVFVPLSVIPMPLLAALWMGIQAILLLVVLWLVYVRFGGVADRRHLVAMALAVIAFTPNVAALYIGNVSAWLAIAIAAMLLARPGPRSGLAAAAAWLKLTPGALLVGAFVDRSTRVPAVAAAFGILAVSFALSPSAWADWLAILPSLRGFFAEVPWTSNLAPSHVLSSTGFPILGSLATVGIPAAFMAVVVVTAWRGRLVAWVAAAVGVYLSATGTSWDHYFVALTPIAVAAWPHGSRVERALIVAVTAWYGPLRFLEGLWEYQLLGLALWLGVLAGAIIQFAAATLPVSQARSVAGLAPTLRSQP